MLSYDLLENVWSSITFSDLAQNSHPLTRNFPDLWALLRLQNTPLTLSISAIHVCLYLSNTPSFMLLAQTQTRFFSATLFDNTDPKDMIAANKFSGKCFREKHSYMRFFLYTSAEHCGCISPERRSPCSCNMSH